MRCKLIAGGGGVGGGGGGVEVREHVPQGNFLDFNSLKSPFLGF